MITGRRIAILLLTAASLVAAHSVESNIIEGHQHGSDLLVSEYEFITYSHMKVHPTIMLGQPDKNAHSPEYSDSFTLELEAYNKTFCLHLHPNYDLVHPDLQQSLAKRSEKYQPAKVYRGYVVAIEEHGNELSEAMYDCGWRTDKPSQESYSEAFGWARISVLSTTMVSNSNRRGSNTAKNVVHHYSGVFTAGNEVYSVKSAEDFNQAQKDGEIKVPDRKDRHVDHQDAELIVHRLSDMKKGKDGAGSKEYWCGADKLEFNAGLGPKLHYQKKAHEAGVDDNMHAYVNNPLENPLRRRSSVPSGCPAEKKILYMGIVADCSYYSAKNFNEDQAYNHLIGTWNTVSGIFESAFNIYLGVHEVVHMRTCGTPLDAKFNQVASDGYTITQRLSDFSEWRGTRDEDSGLWHLMSDGATGSTVGLAWLNMVCQTTAFSQQVSGGTQFVSGTGVSTVVQNEWLVVAHEIGHNLGANHDCTEDNCDICGATGDCSSQSCVACSPSCDCNGDFIMSPTSGPFSTMDTFSPGTRSQICSKVPALGTCLSAPGVHSVLNGDICGNGLVEDGEECDCGGPESCATDACCFQNCTLKPEAVCADSNDLCCSSCQIIPPSAQHVCRPKASECDVEEICTGRSPSCPDEVFVDDGTTCVNATGFPAGSVFGDNATDLACASGACTSRDLQCLLLGDLYEVNGYGKVRGQCDDRFDLAESVCVMICSTEIYGGTSGCLKYSDQFRDGSPCGTSGTCTNGVCSESSRVNDFAKWYLENEALALFLFIASFLVFLYAMYWCCCKRKKAGDEDGQPQKPLKTQQRQQPQHRSSQQYQRQMYTNR